MAVLYNVAPGFVFLYLLRSLEADAALGCAGSAAHGHGVRVRVHPRVQLVQSPRRRRAPPRARVAAVVLLCVVVVVAGAAGERTPPAAAHSAQAPHACACVHAGLPRTGPHEHQELQLVEKHADPVLEHLSLHACGVRQK